MWFGGPSGVARHDGDRVRNFDKSDGLLTHGIRALAPSSNGGIWVGSDCGFDLIDENCRVVNRQEFSAPAGLVECFTVGPQGQVVAGTNYGAYVLEDSTWRRLDPQFDEFISALCFDESGSLWAAASSGLRHWVDNKWVSPIADNWKIAGRLRTLQSVGCNELLIGGDDGLMIVSHAGEADSHRSFALDFGVNAVLLAGEELWIATGSEVLHHSLASGGPASSTLVAPSVANDLFRDQQGNVWIATDSSGVLKVSLMRQAISRPILDPVGAVLSIIAEPTRDVVVVGTESGALISRADGSIPVALTALDAERVWDTLLLDDGTLLAACHSGLVSVNISTSPDVGHVVASGEAVRIGSDHEVLGAPARALLRDDAAVLVGSVRGLCRILNETTEEVERPDGGSLGYVYSMTRIAPNEVWVSTLGDGLWRLVDGQALTPIRSNELSEKGNTYCVSVGLKDTVVLQDNRIIVLDPKTTTTRRVIETKEAVAGWTCVHGVDGSLWVGSSTGLRNYDLSTGKLTRQITSWFGIDAWEFTTSRSLRIDEQSMLWCGVTGGVLMIDPSHLPLANDLPVPQLGDVSWTLQDGTAPQLRDGTFFMTEGKWSFDANMFAAWYIDEADVRFRVRLLGFDRDWSALQVGVARYSSIPAGNYTLQVQAHSPLVGWGPVTHLFTLDVHRSTTTQRAVEILKAVSGSRRRAKLSARRKHDLEQAVRERTIELTRTSELLAEANKELATLSTTDALTGVGNRRSFDQRLESEMRRSTRTGEPLSLLFVDVDHFKHFNDRYGHHIGDTCLQAIGATLTASLQRPNDLAARFGGEEFVVLLPGTDETGARDVAERIRCSVSDDVRAAVVGLALDEAVTVSIGIVTRVLHRAADFSFDSQAAATDLLLLADDAVYGAKHSGRNRIVVAAPQALLTDSPNLHYTV
jgi:diguanylate cyclase (GGDEF)-like protein